MRTIGLTAVMAAMLAVSAPARAQPVTLINVFEVPAVALEETLRYWEAARDILVRQPGYVSTRLHQSLAPDARFSLVNVAVWESPQAFAAANQAMQREMRLTLPAGVRFTPSLYRVVRE
jgi:heme-degrading monooxygenase HmoA